MKIEFDDITAEVYAETNGVYWATLHWGDSGMHTKDFTIRKSKYPDKPLWVQPPKYKPDWDGPFEFSRKSPLLQHIESLCLGAVERFVSKGESASKSQTQDVVLTPEEADYGIEHIDEGLDQAFDELNKAPP